MPTSPTILNKIKSLQRLSGSPNPHEAESARLLAEKLILKYNVMPEELENLKDDPYNDEEKLYGTIGLISWRQQLAVVLTKYFDCQIVQVESVPAEGPHHFDYFVYGDLQDTQTVGFVFHALSNQVQQLIDTNCIDRGPIYIDSYSEGVVDAIKQNIWTFGIDLPNNKMPVRVISSDNITIKTEEIIKPQENKVHADKHVDVRSQSMVKDIGAYFQGIVDGKKIALNDVLGAII
jgi:Protein of unknown function (DUF2786)